MKNRLLRSALVAITGLVLLVPVAPAQNPGPHGVTSDNIEHVGLIREVGDGVGAHIVGNTMFVTSTTHLSVYDISTPEAPVRQGVFTLNVEWENEEVPTNGKILGISASAGCVPVDPAGLPQSDTNCLAIYDVSNPASVKLLDVVSGAGDHTSECILECTYFFGDSGTITDARDPKDAKLLEANWWNNVVDKYGVEVKNSCHHVREVAPGIVLGSCNPLVLISVLPEHGGTVESPALLAQGIYEVSTLVHSSRWPRGGKDKWVLSGQETNAQPQCSDTVAAFQTWNASNVALPGGGWLAGSLFTGPVDEYRPTQGTFADGNSPVNALGCSVHWFHEHPTFRNGGVVAVGAYEQGTRILQVSPDGKITEQGFFQPAGGSTSAPYWHPNGQYIYAVDYTRGVDILKYTGDTYVPTGSGDVVPTPGATPGTGGNTPSAPCASAAGFIKATAVPRGSRVLFDVDRREDSPFTVDVFQQSQGSRVVRERLVARFTGRSESFTWDGVDRKNRKLKDGNYFVRFTMKTKAGQRDTRRSTLTRKGGKWRKAPDFYQRIDCGIFKSLKLTSSVFGGSSKAKLGLAYKLQTPAKRVKIQIKIGSRTVKTVYGKGTQGRTVRFSFPASIARRNQLVKILVTADRAPQRSPTVTLYATRI